MKTTAQQYRTEVVREVAQGWNQFWFLPTGPGTLAWLRLLVGGIGLYMLATYGLDLHRLLGPDGMLPTEVMQTLYPGGWSYLNYVSASQLPGVHGLGMLVVLLFTLGIRTRWTSIGATIVLLSYFHRAPVLTGQAELVLSMLLVYLCIGRSGDALSIKTLWQKRTDKPHAQPQPAICNTVSLRLIQIHLAIIHLMMGVAQLTAEVWWTGEGVWLLASREGGPLVDFWWLVDYPILIAAWSHLITLYLITFSWLVWHRLSRPWMLALGVVVWSSLAVVSGQTMLCLTMLVGTLAFWKKLAVEVGLPPPMKAPGFAGGWPYVSIPPQQYIKHR